MSLLMKYINIQVYWKSFHQCNQKVEEDMQVYGSSPQFICCSATISNPKELAERLTELEVELIDNNGAPQGEKHRSYTILRLSTNSWAYEGVPCWKQNNWQNYSLQTKFRP